MKYLLLLIGIGLCQVGVSQNPKFPPTHELDGDSSLVQFIRQLRKAVAEKNVDYILSVLDKNVRGGQESEGTIKEFIDLWDLRSDTTYFWGFLSRALDLSGAYVNDPNDETGRYKVVFPYLYNYEPGLEDDYFALGCITGKNVNLRSKPDTKAPVVTQLSYDVIFYLYEDPSGMTQSGTNPYGEPEWSLIQTYDKKYKGWVYWKYAYPLVGPRLFLYQGPKGKWLISAFVAGD